MMAFSNKATEMVLNPEASDPAVVQRGDGRESGEPTGGCTAPHILYENDGAVRVPAG